MIKLSECHRAPTTNISDVTLRVSNLERSLRFYKGILGFTTIAVDAHTAQLFVNDNKVLITLIQTEKQDRKRKRTTGLYHVALLLPNRDDLARFLHHLVSYNVPFGASDHIVSEAIYLHDPDGNGIEVYCDRPKETWQWVHEGIVMETKQLDAANLLTEKRGEWRFIPEDTLLGHLHLHVPDLNSYEALYQALGFTKVTEYPGAVFMSAGKYHHHIAINIWNGLHASPPTDKQPGLDSFTIVYYSAAERNKAIQNIRQLNIHVNETENSYKITTQCRYSIYLIVK